VLYNLARLPDFQRDLRAEIQRAGPLDEVDYDKMPLLNAVINVGSPARFFCVHGAGG
jgi:hypothetical protein